LKNTLGKIKRFLSAIFRYYATDEQISETCFFGIKGYDGKFCKVCEKRGQTSHATKRLICIVDCGGTKRRELIEVCDNCDPSASNPKSEWARKQIERNFPQIKKVENCIVERIKKE
jgi:hypothetical protein